MEKLIAKLKEEQYKDKELAKMKHELEIARKDNSRGFPISEKEEKAIKKMPPNWSLSATADNIKLLSEKFGEGNVKVVEKKLEFANKGKYNRY